MAGEEEEEFSLFSKDSAIVAGAAAAVAGGIIAAVSAGRTLLLREAVELAEEIGILDIPVRSSCIASVSYNPVDGMMRITFHDGSVYDYPEKSMADFLGLINASSKGAHFNAYFRGKEPTQFAGSKKQRIKVGRGR